MSTIVIEMRDLRKDFTVYAKIGKLRRERRVVPAVDGIDLRVERGEMLGYIGPNGAGKSTTLKMLTGVLMPSSGAVHVCGLVPVPQRATLAARIGVVFGQRSQLWWDLPLEESFQLLRHIYRVPAEAHAARLRRCVELLDTGRVPGHPGAPAVARSADARRADRRAAARARDPLPRRADDRPRRGQQAGGARLPGRARPAGDTTVVLTTHDLADIERLSRRLVVIDHGRVVHDGTLEELHARYASRRRVEVDLDSPLPEPVALPGIRLVDSAEDGRRLTFTLADGAGAGALVAHLATVGALRDLRVLEPDIEDVVSRLYAQPNATTSGK